MLEEVLKSYYRGDLKFKVTGFGFDGYTGEFHIAALALFDDPEFSKALVTNMKKNWEVKNVQLLDIDSNEVEQLLCSREMYVTGAFGLSCALNELRFELSQQNERVA